MEEQEKYIRALIELHRSFERQGPGDMDFSDYIISQIPELQKIHELQISVAVLVQGHCF